MSARLDDAGRVRLKSDPEVLLAILNLSRLGPRQPCRICGSSDAMSTKRSSDGIYFFHCFSCGKGGDCFRAYAFVHQISDGDAMQRIAESGLYAIAPRPDVRRPTKRPRQRDLDNEIALARGWALDLEHDNELQDFLWRTRAITEDTATRWGLGAKDVRRNANGRIVGCTWTMPILSHEPPRQLIGVKLHRQNPPPGVKKGGWLIGGGAGLFPLPEALNLAPGDLIIIAPGELKALDYMSAGVLATAPTTGESMSLKSWQRLAPRFTGLVVRLDPDRENSKAAMEFKTNISAALQNVAFSIEVLE